MRRIYFLTACSNEKFGNYIISSYFWVSKQTLNSKLNLFLNLVLFFKNVDIIVTFMIILYNIIGNNFILIN